MTFGDAFPGLFAIVLALAGWLYGKHIVAQSQRETERLRRERGVTPAE